MYDLKFYKRLSDLILCKTQYVTKYMGREDENENICAKKENNLACAQYCISWAEFNSDGGYF